MIVRLSDIADVHMIDLRMMRLAFDGCGPMKTFFLLLFNIPLSPLSKLLLATDMPTRCLLDFGVEADDFDAPGCREC